MALVKETLAAKIKEAFDKQSDKGKSDNEKNAEMAAARAEMADDIANAIHEYIIQGKVTTTVTGTCPDGPVTGSGTGSIS